MATLSSLSSDDEVFAAYEDNASYAQDDSPARAAAFVAACRFLVLRLPRMYRQGNVSAEMNIDLIAEQMREAQQWLEARSAGVRHLNLDDFRR